MTVLGLHIAGPNAVKKKKSIISRYVYTYIHSFIHLYTYIIFTLIINRDFTGRDHPRIRCGLQKGDDIQGH